MTVKKKRQILNNLLMSSNSDDIYSQESMVTQCSQNR